MNPHYDVIIEGLLKRLDEQGNKREDIEYVINRVIGQATPPQVFEACCDPCEFDENIKLKAFIKVLENISSQYSSQYPNGDPNIYFNFRETQLEHLDIKWSGTFTLKREDSLKLEPSVFFNFSE